MSTSHRFLCLHNLQLTLQIALMDMTSFNSTLSITRLKTTPLNCQNICVFRSQTLLYNNNLEISTQPECYTAASYLIKILFNSEIL